jgi:hypothetical protein
MAGRRLPRVLAWGCVAVGLAAGGAAHAQERKAYKYVDEKGNVVYSQNPPSGKDAKQIGIAPAHRGAGGSTTRGPYDDPNRYSSDRQDQYSNALRERQKAAEEAERKRLADLEAECNRNRGADCKNPETLRLLESNQMPGGRRYPYPGR